MDLIMLLIVTFSFNHNMDVFSFEEGLQCDFLSIGPLTSAFHNLATNWPSES